MKKWMMMGIAVFAMMVCSVASAANYTIEIERGFWSRKPHLVIRAENGKVVASGETLANFTDAVKTATNLSEGEFEIVDRFHK